MKNGNIALKSLLALGALFAFAAPTLAQTSIPAPKPGPVTPVPAAPVKRQNRYAALNLTADQQAKIKGIEKAARAQAKAVKTDTTLTPDQQKAKMKAIRADSRTQVMAILTPEQKAKLPAHGKKGAAK